MLDIAAFLGENRVLFGVDRLQELAEGRHDSARRGSPGTLLGQVVAEELLIPGSAPDGSAATATSSFRSAATG